MEAATLSTQRGCKDYRQSGPGSQAENTLSDGGGAKMVILTRRMLSDRAFDALMLMGTRPSKPNA